jgi:glucosamine-6-phosphate deaminase
VGAAELTVDRLRVRVLADPGAVARVAAAHAAMAVRDALDARGAAHVMFASGNSQLRFLAALAVEPDVDWSRVLGFHMDEYVGLSDDHPAGVRRYMRQRVAGPLGIGTLHALDGTAAAPGIEADRYAAVLQAHPIDLCCLGIGENGHLAFNEHA